MGALENLLRDGVVNCSAGFYDSFTQSNARQHASAGMETTITRDSAGGCCKWCRAMDGTYSYSKRNYPDDIFRRHENCRCKVYTTTSSGSVSDAWTKEVTQASRQKTADRVAAVERSAVNDFTAAISKAEAAVKSAGTANIYSLNAAAAEPLAEADVEAAIKETIDKLESLGMKFSRADITDVYEYIAELSPHVGDDVELLARRRLVLGAGKAA